jgi:hypothetical protein
MDNIIQLAREYEMNQPTPVQATEHAQVLCSYDIPITPIIYRFNNVKKGRKAYEEIVKAWKARGGFEYSPNKKQPPRYFDMKADMFDGAIDLDRIVSISIVEWPKRDHFIPRG